MSDDYFNPNQLLTCQELADLTRIPYSTIRYACRASPGKVKISLPPITRIGVRVRFRADQVRDWLVKLSESPPTSADKEHLNASVNASVVAVSKASRRPGRPRNAGGQK